MAYKYWKKEELKILKKFYSYDRIENLSHMLDRTKNAIFHKANRLGIKNKIPANIKYYINENFFAKPNLLNSYWAGFIAADGNIYSNPNKNSVSLVLGLAKKDRLHLEKFSNDIEYTGPIKKRKDGLCLLKICNKKICEDLKNNFNIIQNKTFLLRPPKNLSKNQILAYIVGYIDGDGCISVRKDNYNQLSISIAGQKKILLWIHKNLKNIFKLKFDRIPITDYKTWQTYSLYNKKTAVVGTVLKQLNCPKLERKWSKVQILR